MKKQRAGYVSCSRQNELFNLPFEGHGDGKPGKGDVTFDNFVQACVNVKTLTDSFRSFDTDNDGWIQINYEQVKRRRRQRRSIAHPSTLFRSFWNLSSVKRPKYSRTLSGCPIYHFAPFIPSFCLILLCVICINTPQILSFLVCFTSCLVSSHVHLSINPYSINLPLPGGFSN